MSGRGGSASITASPTIVAAFTTLIVIVAVWLAYSANSGLPFVPVDRISVEIPGAARLIDDNQVRIEGERVGVVESVAAIPDPQASATAHAGGGAAVTASTEALRLNLKLDQTVEPLPVDSLFQIRSGSAGGEYLEIIRGEGDPAREGFVFEGRAGRR